MAKRVGGFIGQDGLNAPDEPTNVSGTAGDERVSVSFTAPSDVGGSAITGYRVTDSTGTHGASGSSSPITVSGLTNGSSYTFRVWAINPFGWSGPSGVSGSVTPAVPPIGIIGAGSGSNVIQYVNIATTGVTTDWGDMSSTSREKCAGAGSSSRALLSTGTNGFITYITYASQGDAVNFGALSVSRYNFGAFSNSTRAVYGGGFNNGVQNVLDYVTIASTGTAADFGDILATGLDGMAGCGSSTRGLITGGYDNEYPAVQQNTISYVTIASTGNTTDFGDMTVVRDLHGAASNSTRAIFAQTYNSNVMDYVTIASTGNATDFGDLVTGADSHGTWGLASSTRAIFGGASSCDYVEIATTGNSVDFVSLASSGDGRRVATSNCHGGLA